MASGAETLSARFSSRFAFVTLLPNLVVVAVIAGVLAAGAPNHVPTFDRVTTTVKDLDGWGWAALLALILIGSVAVHPLQTPLIQLLEGYWQGLPLGSRFAVLARRRFERAQDSIAQDLQAEDNITSTRGLERDRWMPTSEETLPTELGNVLSKGESLASSRYGMPAIVAFPRLMHVAPSDELGPLLDRRNQLDASARLSAAFLLTSAVTLGLLLPTGRWMWVPLSCMIFAWGSYRSAVAATKSFSDELQVLADLYHLDLWKALRLPVPRNLAEELQRGPLLLPLLRYGTVTPSQAESLFWTNEA
jgi:hypothetical protein